MEVELISRSGEWLDVLWTAARTCKSEDSPQKLYGRSIEETWNDDDRLKNHIALIVSLVKAGHLSILEHATMTFAVSGVSRALLAQYSRHRVGVSLSVQSQRYVKMNARDVVLPPSIESDDSAHCAWKLAVGEIEKAYNALVALGVKKEDARFILPNAVKTNFVTTLNLRSLHDLFVKRVCVRGAQWEIKEMVNRFVEIVEQVEPWTEAIFEPLRTAKVEFSPF